MPEDPAVKRILDTLTEEIAPERMGIQDARDTVREVEDYCHDLRRSLEDDISRMDSEGA